MISLVCILHTCSISPNIREGLLEAFYGVYEKDPDKVSLWEYGLMDSLGIEVLVNDEFGIPAGASSYGSNGCPCSNRRYDCCQKNSSIFPY